MTNDLFSRSIEIIKANQAAGGAYMASPNFEQYHYCWFRDGAYIAYALDLAGEHDSPARFYDWAAGNIAGRASQVGRAVATAAQGQVPAPDDILHTRYTMDGAVSSDDWPNFQLDGFGTLLWGMSRHLDLMGALLMQHLPPGAKPLLCWCSTWARCGPYPATIVGRSSRTSCTPILWLRSTAVCGPQPLCLPPRQPVLSR